MRCDPGRMTAQADGTGRRPLGAAALLEKMMAVQFQNSDTLAFLVMKPGDGKAIYNKLADRGEAARQEVAKPITPKGGLSPDDASKLLDVVA